MINFTKYSFHPVIHLPKGYDVYDFSQGYDENRFLKIPYGVGKYNEKRINMYKGELYATGRDIHMGIDIGAPVGTPVHAFYEGKVLMTSYNSKELDYGYTIITEHNLDGQNLYVLHGHLSKKSLEQSTPGKGFKSGDILGWIGDKSENGGWNPHLHIQLSYEKPLVCDMPGAVHENDLQEALLKYPNPELILGKLY